MKERLIEFLAYLGMGQNKFEERVGIARGYVSNFSGNITMKTLDKIASTYPELNTNWLKTGEGQMLKPLTQTAHIGHDNFGVANIGTLNGNVHAAAKNKDEVVEIREKSVLSVYRAFLTELKGLHHYIERQDQYVRGQDQHIDDTLKEVFLNNERQMERIDKLIVQQGEMIKLISEQCRISEERAGRLLDMLEKKI